MRFAVLPPVNSGVTANGEWIAAYAAHAESAGFESMVLVEHPVVVAGHDPTYPYSATGQWVMPTDAVIPDPLDVLAYIASATSRLGLATGVLVLPMHHPVILAKRLATIDQLSQGRLRTCVGVGWMHEELEAVGVEFASRGRRADEAIDVMRLLWSDVSPDGASFSGEFFSFSGAVSRPRPYRPAGVPIHIGGHSVAAARRAGTRGDGFQPLGVSGDRLRELLDVVASSARAAGRNADSIELTLGGRLATFDTDRSARAEEAGATRIVLSAGADIASLAEATEELSAAAERLRLAPLTRDGLGHGD